MKILLTDCTLAELDAYDAEPGRLFQLLRELEKLPVAALELSSAVVSSTLMRTASTCSQMSTVVARAIHSRAAMAPGMLPSTPALMNMRASGTRNGEPPTAASMPSPKQAAVQG